MIRVCSRTRRRSIVTQPNASIVNVSTAPSVFESSPAVQIEGVDRTTTSSFERNRRRNDENDTELTDDSTRAEKTPVNRN